MGPSLSQPQSNSLASSSKRSELPRPSPVIRPFTADQPLKDIFFPIYLGLLFYFRFSESVCLYVYLSICLPVCLLVKNSKLPCSRLAVWQLTTHQRLPTGGETFPPLSMNGKSDRDLRVPRPDGYLMQGRQRQQ